MKPQTNDHKLKDEPGLYLLVKASGAKLWRQRYTLHGRENMLGLGAYLPPGLTTWCGVLRGRHFRLWSGLTGWVAHSV